MNVYEKAVSELRDNRREALDSAHLAWQTAVSENDALYAAFCAYQEQMIAAARNKPNTLAAEELNLKSAITASGFDLSTFSPPYACEKCKDTGKVDGKYCRCVIRRVIKADRGNLAMSPVDFESAEKSAPTAAIKKAYGLAREYVSSRAAKPFFVIIGTPGTGKTYLAAAILGAAMARGEATVAVTAFDFVRRALDYHTQFSIPDYTDRFTPMLDCDLLVIDDLGTESMLKNVTREYLYTVINERWKSGKRTVITSNLTPSELNARYGENIFSRMCDTSRAVLLSVDAKNTRLKPI